MMTLLGVSVRPDFGFLRQVSLINFKASSDHGYHPPIGWMVTESLLPGQTRDKNAECIGLHYCNGPNNCYKLFFITNFYNWKWTIFIWVEPGHCHSHIMTSI